MIVIDTQTLVWWTGGSKKLSKRAESALRRNREIVIPSICLWEYAMLSTRGRIRLKRSLQEALGEILAQPDVVVHPITVDIGIRAAGLSLGRPMDPADQLVAATALELGVPLITSDLEIQALPGLDVIW